MLAGLAAGCGPSGSKTGQQADTDGCAEINTGGRGDGAGPGGAGAGETVSGSGGAAGGTSEPAGGVEQPGGTCQMSVEQLCEIGNAGKPCPRTWPGADGLLTVCPNLSYGRVVAVDCGPYLAIVDSSVDTYNTYYYDAITRSLAAIVFNYAGTLKTARGPNCVAGPAGAKAASFPESCEALSDLVTCPR